VNFERSSFGRVAIRMGLIDKAQLDAAMHQLRTRGCSVQRALVEAGVLTPELAAAVRAATQVVRRSA
jgi:hypothetical protein